MVVARNGTSYGTYNLTGGVLIQSATGSNLIVGYAGTGVLNVSGSGLANSIGGVIVGNGANGNGQVNNLMSGGTINTNKFSMTAGTSTFNFNGGLVQSSSTSTAFMQGLTNAYVYSGGAIFNATGYNDVVGQSLLAADGYGLNGGSIAVASGGSGYLAPPEVLISGGSGTGATAKAVLDGSGHVIDIVITNPGRGYLPTDSLTATFLGGLASGGTTAAAPLSISSSNLSQNGPGSLTVLGGYIAFTGINTYTGPTIISAGTLTVGTTASLPNWPSPIPITVPSGAGFGVRTGDGVTTGFSSSQIDSVLGLTGSSAISFTDSSSTFVFDTTSSSFTYGSNINKNISVAFVGANTLTLTGSNSYTGTTTFAGTGSELILSNTAAIPGSLIWNSNNNTIDMDVNGGTFYTNITNNPNPSSGTYRMRLIAGASNVTYAGVMGGTVSSQNTHGFDLNSDAARNIQTANTLTLTGTISLGGSTPSFMNDFGPVIVAGGGLLDTSAFSELAMSSSVSLTVGAGGTLVLGPLYVGASGASLVVDGGTVRHSAATGFNTIGSTSFYINNGGMTVDTQGFNLTYPMSLQPGNSGASTGGLTKVGSGLLLLTNSNSYAGNTVIQAGTLQLGNFNARGVGGVAANGGTLDLNGFGVTVPSFSGAAGVVTNKRPWQRALLTVSQSIATTFGGSLVDTGANEQISLALTGPGSLTLTGTNAYSGGTTVANGSLILDGAASLLAGTSLTIGSGAGPGAIFSPPAITHTSQRSRPPLLQCPSRERSFLLLSRGYLAFCFSDDESTASWIDGRMGGTPLSLRRAWRTRNPPRPSLEAQERATQSAQTCRGKCDQFPYILAITCPAVPKPDQASRCGRPATGRHAIATRSSARHRDALPECLRQFAPWCVDCRDRTHRAPVRKTA